MAKRQTIEDSPFYVELTGANVRNSGYNFRPNENISNDIEKFLKSRFGDVSKTNMINQIVYDYYFRYAHDRTYYERTIIALIHKKELVSDNPTIIPMFVLNRYHKDMKNEVIIDESIIDNFNLMQYVAYSEPFSDISDELQKDIITTIVSDGFDADRYKVFNALKNFNEDSLKDFFVLEIPLNNYLDVELNGVYCYEDTNNDKRAVESLHVGLCIIVDNDKDVNATPIPLIIVWNLSDNFTISPFEISIEKISLDELQTLCQKYNPMMFAVLKFFEIANTGYQDKLSKNRQEQKRLLERLVELQEQEKELEKLI